MKHHRLAKYIVAGIALTLIVGTAAAAGALRAVFAEPDYSALDATVNPEPSSDTPEVAATLDRGPASPSLDAARAEGLFPFQWPWFSDEVPTPTDALTGGSDLAAVLASVPELAHFKVLSAERRSIVGEADLEVRHAWVKVNDNELLAISTQLITDDLAIPAEGNTVIAYAGGQATVEFRQEHAILTRFIRGERMVLVDLQLVTPSSGLSMTGDEVLAIAAAIMDSFDKTG